MTTPTDDNGIKAHALPPYIAASTFLAVIASWQAVRPSSVTRQVLSRVAGSVQTWFIAALRYFDLIDDLGRPTEKLDALATADADERAKLIAAMLRDGYPFLFAPDVDLSRITQADLKAKFEATGAKGETAVKAMTFFTSMAKEAGIKLSPFIATRARRSSNGKKTAKPKASGPPPNGKAQPTATPPTPAMHETPRATPMQVLIDMLSVSDMTAEEQQAVWTLIRYLKKAGT